MASSNSIGVHSFKEEIQGEIVHFHVLRLKGSFMLWIGTEAIMKTLAIAMTSNSVIVSTLISVTN